MKPEEPHWKLYALLSGIYLKSRRLSEESIKPLKITFPQFGALLNLSFQDNITQKELSQRLDTDTTTVMVICDSLEKKGYLKRLKDPTDRRVNRLVLSNEGRNVFAKAYPLMMNRYKFFADAISQKEVEVIIPLLEQLYHVIKIQYQKELNR
ncbi:MarR family winged helix-turn-helix transcriptional regulator [Thermoproteota archaeon]